MESLDSACNILRHKNRHDLANLLSRAFLDFEFVDIGIPIDNINADIEIVDAAIFAPYTDCEHLRALSQEDCELVLECLREIWPYRGGFSSMAIRDVVYRVDPNAAEDERNDLFQSLTGWPRVDRTLDQHEVAVDVFLLAEEGVDHRTGGIVHCDQQREQRRLGPPTTGGDCRPSGSACPHGACAGDGPGAWADALAVDCSARR